MAANPADTSPLPPRVRAEPATPQQWPLNWFNDPASQVWRVWTQSAVPKARVPGGNVGKSAPGERSNASDVRDKPDPPTSIDWLLHASMGRFTFGLAPSALWLTYSDWAIHLWSSPGKQQQLVGGTDVTFVLTSGGHNAGILSEPGHKGRHYRISRHAADAQYLDPDTWRAKTAIEEGSWWPAWLDWLDGQSHGRMTPPSLGASDKGLPPLQPASGRYVLER